ncbi:hypothetical protein [Pelolinea submarina]|uniref:Uncharacterized protein n=1 Tax=Pelolinea submarina TaxID=913107 RepID=A0A347ZNM7_9CHLR|nr:hypothetical protein [Pelolinea submarina]REG08511.1 hypothetical protein DFR64_1879 [Pelolinea submarina]BBB46908.1 hypothetical protein Pelsub_P0135 [Pelolinea submarina]
MEVTNRRHTPWILWPFRLIFELIEWILRATGRLVAAVLGLVIMIVGCVLTLTIVAAPIGMPMIVFGLVLMVRGIF